MNGASTCCSDWLIPCFQIRKGLADQPDRLIACLFHPFFARGFHLFPVTGPQFIQFLGYLRPGVFAAFHHSKRMCRRLSWKQVPLPRCRWRNDSSCCPRAAAQLSQTGEKCSVPAAWWKGCSCRALFGFRQPFLQNLCGFLAVTADQLLQLLLDWIFETARVGELRHQFAGTSCCRSAVRVAFPCPGGNCGLGRTECTHHGRHVLRRLRGLAFENHAQYRPKPKKQHQKHNGYEGKGVYEVSKIVRKGFNNAGSGHGFKRDVR